MPDAANSNADLIFEMGLYKAKIPTRLHYCEIHFWFDPTPENRTRIGLTSYAARLLSDLFRIDWKIQVGTELQGEQLLGEVESTKAVSDLYAPLTGRVTAINAAAVDDPSILSVDPYVAWLFEVDGEPQGALNAQQYIEFLAAGWEETVQMLKGQV